MAIIVFGQKEDPHITETLLYCEKAGIHTVMFNHWSLDQGSLYFDSGSIVLNLNGYEINSKSRDVFWWRIKPNFSKNTITFKDSVQESHFNYQWDRFLTGIEYAFPNLRFINNKLSRALGTSKIAQLALASEIGFTIPNTLIGNQSEKIRDYFDADVFFKPLTSHQFSEENLGNYTCLYKTSELLKMTDKIRGCPTILQSYQDKLYEIRTCVFGSRIVSFKIDSQALDITKHDWRRFALPAEYHQLYQLDEVEENLCKTLIHKLGLDYGIFDLVRRKDGALVFLEVNIDGQWLWLQRHTGFNIAEYASSMLLQLHYENNNPSHLEL